MPIISDISKLEANKAKVAKLEKAIASKLSKELASLPAAYGFDSLNAFIRAFRKASPGKAPGGAGSTKRTRRKRAVITEAVRLRVKKLVGAGQPGSKIAKAVGISLPSVQNIKKALGLVKARKAEKAKPRKAAKKRPARKAPAPKPAAPKPAAPQQPALAEAPKQA